MTKWSLLSASPWGIGTGTVLAGARALRAFAPLIAATPCSSRAILAPTLPKVLTPKRAIAAAPTQEESGGQKGLFCSTPPLLHQRSDCKYRAAVPPRKNFFPPRQNFLRAQTRASASLPCA